MSDRLDDFGPDTDVRLVTFTQPTNLEPYSSDNKLRFPILVDLDRSAYRAFGLGRGSVRRVYGWRTLRRYAQILGAAGREAGLTRSTEDTLQLGGDFVVDRAGRLVYGHWGQGPDDRPPVEDLIAAVADSV